MITYILRGLTLGIVAASQPGPLQVYLLGQTVKQGWRKTVPAAFAPLLSDGPIVLAVLLVLALLPAWWVSALRLCGGLYLFYLAYAVWQDFRVYVPQSAETLETPAQQSLFKAALVNLLNPNPYIFWSTVNGPAVIEAWQIGPLLAILFVISFYGAMIGGMLALMATFGRIGTLGNTGKWLLLLSAVALAIFALLQLWQARVLFGL